MSRHERAFRRLVRRYPAAFRDQYEDQLVGLFADQLRDSRTSGSSLALVRLWAHTLIDLIATAPEQHFRKDAPVLQPVESISVPATAPRSPLQRVTTVTTAVPVIVWGAVWVVAPGYMQPVFWNPPAILGLPMGVLIAGFAGGMALFGWLVARRAQTVGVAVAALAFLTIPALSLIVMTPALILFLIDTAG